MEREHLHVIGRRRATVGHLVPVAAAAERAAFGVDGVRGDLRLADGAGDGAVGMEAARVLADAVHRRVVAELLEPVDGFQQYEYAREAGIRTFSVSCRDEDRSDRQSEHPHSQSSW